MTASEASLRRWQRRTVALLCAGYAGYYLCRSHLSVAMPLLVEELATRGFARDAAKLHLGWLVSLGVFAYAIGKFASGGVTDFVGGRRAFLCGMAGAVACTLAFAASGALPLFTAAWVGNRLVQSMGWPGLVKIASRWFGPEHYGRAMGWLSLSYLVGDAGARAALGALLQMGVGWRGLFAIAAAILAALTIVVAALLRESPRDRGLAEPSAGSDSVFGAAAQDPTPASLGALLAPLVRSRAFLLVCALSLGLTLLRETFNTWTPLYFVEALGMTAAGAASWSAVFPGIGAIAVLGAGFVGDRAGPRGRAAAIFAGLVLACAVLLVLALSKPGAAAGVALVAAVALCSLGPYSYLAGAVSLDFGGKRGSATACGIIDGVGYLGGVLAGGGMSRLSVAFGWDGAFAALAGVAAASASMAALFWREERGR